MTIRITSPAFPDSGRIPVRYTCDGEDLSPPLQWEGIPQGTQSLTLIADDPDAPMGTWVHWVLYDITAANTGLDEGLPTTPKVTGVGTHGVNDFRRSGYGGPCPPPGKPHRYFFKLYALDTMLNLPPGVTKAALEKALQGHILAQGQLIGTYGR